MWVKGLVSGFELWMWVKGFKLHLAVWLQMLEYGERAELVAGESKEACERTGCTRRARRYNDETIPEGILPDVTDLCGYTGVRIRTCSMGHGRAVCVMTTYPNTLWRYTLQITLRHPPVIKD